MPPNLIIEIRLWIIVYAPDFKERITPESESSYPQVWALSDDRR